MMLIEKAAEHLSRTAIISNGQSYTYHGLLEASEKIAANLLSKNKDLREKRIAFLIEPSFEYTALQWGIWRAGGIAVPLCVLHPLPSMQYVVEDSGAFLIIAHENYKDLLQPLEKSCGVPLLSLDELLTEKEADLPEINIQQRAMILYTSGTTSKPKGVVTTHRHINAQINTLVGAWEWEKEDHILNVLPLHHVHGIINVMSCALAVGACCEFLPKFDASEVWRRLGSGELSLFMGVPTMYYQLIKYWEDSSGENQIRWSTAASRLRLMVSGSAALPVSVMEQWQLITSHTLLERYGMTEIGMGLSNSYSGERRPGHVGLPLPEVELKLVDSDFKEVSDSNPGEILIKGPSVFEEYWNKPEATKDAFTDDGWFKTGDIAVFNKGSYKILGRNSVDIIKSGGYKISALEIEDVLRTHPEINDCAVIGIPDEEWGEVVAAGVVITADSMDTKKLNEWIREYLPAYKIPREYLFLTDLPRNILGKVTKNVLKDQFRN